MKVSVVMPAYNAEKYIEQAVRSVLDQTYPNFELIIVDDCSQDATAEIAQKLAQEDERIMLLQNPQNSGVSASRNIGVLHAQGEWIAFLDSDDMWTTDKLEKQMALVSVHPDAALFYTGSAFVDQNGVRYRYEMPVESEVTYRTLLRRNLLSCSSVLVKRDFMERYPMRNPKTHEDYGTWLRIMRETRVAYGIDEPLLIYRIAKGSRSSNRVKSAGMYYLTCRDVGYNSAASAFLTFRYTFYSVWKRWKIYSGGKEKLCG